MMALKLENDICIIYLSLKPRPFYDHATKKKTLNELYDAYLVHSLTLNFYVAKIS